MHHPRPHATAAHSKRLEQLAAAIEAYRGNKPRRRLSPGLRAQVVAAIDAGATVRAVRAACKVSASQIGRWRQAAALSGDDVAPSSAPVLVSPRVLSVVDEDTRECSKLDDEIELRSGGWHVSLRRTAR
jgi:transposase-like protein